MTYTVKKIPLGTNPWNFGGAFSPDAVPPPFDQLEEARIDLFPWLDDAPDCFLSYARVGWNEEGLTVLMYAKEYPIQSKETRMSGMQCCDSCMEFFFKPFPDEDDRFLNIEINPSGIPHIGLGNGRGERKTYHEPIPGMTITTSEYDGKYWAFCYRVPAAFLEEIYGRKLQAGQTMKGNFYKCAEQIHRHFGTWSPIVAPHPDFHRPECFADLVLEG